MKSLPASARDCDGKPNAEKAINIAVEKRRADIRDFPLWNLQASFAIQSVLTSRLILSIGVQIKVPQLWMVKPICVANDRYHEPDLTFSNGFQMQACSAQALALCTRDQVFSPQISAPGLYFDKCEIFLLLIFEKEIDFGEWSF
jgi:hypothetical protein